MGRLVGLFIVYLIFSWAALFLFALVSGRGWPRGDVLGSVESSEEVGVAHLEPVGSGC
jgi:hypothetical protein